MGYTGCWADTVSRKLKNGRQTTKIFEMKSNDQENSVCALIDIARNGIVFAAIFPGCTMHDRRLVCYSD